MTFLAAHVVSTTYYGWRCPTCDESDDGFDYAQMAGNGAAAHNRSKEHIAKMRARKTR